MVVTMLKITEIKPYDKNPRYNDEAVEAVANSIKEFGFKNPIIIDKNNVIVCGHTRYKAAKKLKLETVPTILADDLSDEQIKAFRLADNKVSEIATWDEGLLSDELDSILDIDMSEFGFDFSADDEEKEAEEDNYDEELPENPTTQYGDVYRLGNHILMCGDSTQEEEVLQLMGTEKADLLITDPPYNTDYHKTTTEYSRRVERKEIANDKMDDESFRSFLNDVLKSADAAMKPGAVYYMFHSDKAQYEFRGAFKDIGWDVKQIIIWYKKHCIPGRNDYQNNHEPIAYGWKKGTTHLWASDRKQTTVVECSRYVKSKIHPTMKPIGLFDYFIKNNTKQGDIVLDLFCGSGTTIMACEQNGRQARCMEIDPQYVDAAIDRWEKFTGQKAEKIAGIEADDGGEVRETE